MIEVNGPANIIMIVEMLYDTKQITKGSRDLLVAQAELTIDYLKQLSNTKGVMWYDIKRSI